MNNNKYTNNIEKTFLLVGCFTRTDLRTPASIPSEFAVTTAGLLLA